jgi:hypothetical protein
MLIKLIIFLLTLFTDTDTTDTYSIHTTDTYSIHTTDTYSIHTTYTTEFGYFIYID